MKLSLSIACRTALFLFALACVASTAQTSLAQSLFSKSLQAISQRVIVTPPKVQRFGNPSGNYGSGGYTNPCFIVPGAYQAPIDPNTRYEPGFSDSLWFWFE